MRAASSQLIAYLNAQRAAPDSQMIFADCFLFQYADGSQEGFTNADTPITFGGVTYSASKIQVDGLKFTCATGTDIDKQKISIAATGAMVTLGGVPWLEAIQNGILDGTFITRYRAFLNSWLPADCADPIGTVILFKGRVGTVDKVGRTQAEISVNSDLVLLDTQMPRKLYSPACLHVLYDSGCTLLESNFTYSGTVGAGPAPATIPWAGTPPVALSNFVQGRLTFLSGVNAGITATVKSATGSALILSYPLLDPASPGDSFKVAFGCDHTMATCQAKFNNLANFLGFPFIPPPTYAL